VAPLAALIIIVALLCTAAAHLFGAGPDPAPRRSAAMQSQREPMKIRRLILDEPANSRRSVMPIVDSSEQRTIVIEHY
jgi:hypothetical protein